MTMLRALAAFILLPYLPLAQVPPERVEGPHVAQAADEKAVLATIDALFASFETGDPAAMLRQVHLLVSHDRVSHPVIEQA